MWHKCAFAILVCASLSACDAMQHQALKAYMTFEKGMEANGESDIVASDEQTFRLAALTDSLDFPWGFDFLPDGRILVTERPGRLQLLDPASGELEQIKGVPEVHYKGQGGLLDVRVHPDFERNRYIYLSAAVALDDTHRTTRVQRFMLDGKRLAQPLTVFEAQPAETSNIHFGGALIFDNDGRLMITMGDRKRRHLAQKLDNSLGKVVRVNGDGSIPDDNPFAGRQDALAEIFTYGHRNPQGIAIDRETGNIWAAEHGPQGGDEINLLSSGSNYGWPVITYGEEYGGGKIGEGTHREGMQQPLHYYVPSIGTSGLAYYDSAALPGWEGDLFVGGLRSFSVSRLSPEGDNAMNEERLLENYNFRVRALKQGPDGALYMLSENGGILRMSPAAQP